MHLDFHYDVDVEDPEKLDLHDHPHFTSVEIHALADVVIFHGQKLVSKLLCIETLFISKTFQYFGQIVEQRFKFITNRFALFYTMFSRTATGVQHCIVSFLVLQSLWEYMYHTKRFLTLRKFSPCVINHVIPLVTHLSPMRPQMKIHDLLFALKVETQLLHQSSSLVSLA